MSIIQIQLSFRLHKDTHNSELNKVGVRFFVVKMWTKGKEFTKLCGVLTEKC
jgi:hypothetical protein